MKFFKKILGITVILGSLYSCKKSVLVPPPTTEVVTSTVFNSNSTAASALSGIYITMVGNSVGGGNHGISALTALSSDDFTLYPNAGDGLLVQVYENALPSRNTMNIWGDLYNCIYQSNAAITAIPASSGMTPAMKQQLTGEAEFVRAFCYFYLVNLYGNVPLALTPDYKVNEVLARSSQTDVYKQIIADLTNAQTLLSDNYLGPNGAVTSERVRPNKGAAAALLARVYLFTGDWKDAETQATNVIDDANYNLPSDINSVFLSTSSEAIWQLELPDNGFNTSDGFSFLLPDLGGPNRSAPFILNSSLVNSFEPGDLRRTNWIDSTLVNSITYYFPYKYKLFYTGAPPTEYPVLLRLGEQYLIRAEARAEQGNTGGAQVDLNVIRNRAGLGNTTAATQSDLLAAILMERRHELFTEYGHRWLDLKRTGNINSLMSILTPEKGGGAWKATDQLYPVPFGDIYADPNLVQNPGYN